MIPADAESISVTSNYPDEQIRIAKFDARGYGWRATMNAVQPISIHVVWKTAGTTNSRNHHEFLTGNIEIRQYFLSLREDRIIPAARAPSHFLIRFEILP